MLGRLILARTLISFSFKRHVHCMHRLITWSLSLSTLVLWKNILWLGRSRLPKDVSFRQEKYHVAWVLQGWRHCNTRSSYVRKHWCKINISHKNGKLGTFWKVLLSQCRIIYYDNFFRNPRTTFPINIYQ